MQRLNFKKNVIGSDETGKGEVFRPLIVVAAYAKKENVEELIKYNIENTKGGKQIEKNDLRGTEGKEDRDF